MHDKVTPSQLAAGMRTIQAVAEAIREVGEVPSGHLYAAVMSVVDLQGFERIIGILKHSKLVEESNNVLRWVGPDAGLPKAV